MSIFFEPSRTDSYKLFDRIAFRYDIFNRVSSLGLDVFWRRKLALHLKDKNNLKVLDVASGTGEVLLSLFKNKCDVSHAVGIDASAEMLAIARGKLSAYKVDLLQADAVNLPFADNEFDAATCAFGVRNFTDFTAAIKQMLRILKPGGRLLILEFSLPRNRIIKRLYLFYLRYIIPLLGKIIVGDIAAYRYLSNTIQTFPSGDDFCRQVRNAGFKEVSAVSLTFGVVTLYSATKYLE